MRKVQSARCAGQCPGPRSRPQVPDKPRVGRRVALVVPLGAAFRLRGRHSAFDGESQSGAARLRAPRHSEPQRCQSISQLDEPNLEDQVSDLGRVTQALDKEGYQIHTSISLWRELPKPSARMIFK